MSIGAWNWWPLPMAQPDNGIDSILYVGQIGAAASSGNNAISLLHANRNGGIAYSPYSGNLSLGIIKPATRPCRWYDYDFGAVLTGRVQDPTPMNKHWGTGYFDQLYAHIRLYIVDITAGITPIDYGPSDALLGMGSLLFSHNTHPIPHISLGIERWTAFPGLFGYVEIKGGLTHGWLNDNNPYVKQTLLHHKYIGGRVGGRLPINVSYEFHHAAQWGGYSAEWGDLGNQWRDFASIFTAQSGGIANNETHNAQGNHIASQTLTMTIKGDKWSVDMYWQNLQEDGPIRFIGFGMNNKDGLWGIKMHQTLWPFIHSASIEFLQTTDQSGPLHDRDGLIFGGNDCYYANSIYRQGWTYFGRTIGCYLMSPTDSRIMAGQIGISGDIYTYQYRILTQYSKHWGTYSIPISTSNTAWLIEVNKHIEKAWGLDFSIALSMDIGSQYGTQVGALLSIRKQGIIKTY